MGADAQTKKDGRALGNDAFKRGCWGEALEWYTRAITEAPLDHRLFTNRSTCNLKVKGLDTNNAGSGQLATPHLTEGEGPRLEDARLVRVWVACGGGAVSAYVAFFHPPDGMVIVQGDWYDQSTRQPAWLFDTKVEAESRTSCQGSNSGNLKNQSM